MVLYRKKVLIKSFLLQVAFVLSGYNCLFAHVNQDRMHHSSIIVLERFVPFNYGTAQNNNSPIIQSDASGSKEENSGKETLEAEYEEDELTSFKKCVESNYFTALCDSSAIRFFSPYIKEHLAFRKDSYALSASKPYLLFRVFRL